MKIGVDRTMAKPDESRTRALKIGVVGLFHETNSFAPGETTLNDFIFEYVSGNEAFRQRYEHTRTSMGGVIDECAAQGFELAVGLYTAAMPGGIVREDTVNELIDRIVDSACDDAAGFVVILHGAMVGRNCPDPEGELLSRLRAKLGDDMPIAVTVDLHANISDKMCEHTPLIIGFDTYPHIDAYERAREAVVLLARCLRGEIRPTAVVARPRMLVAPHAMMTEAEPMRTLMKLAFAIEHDPGVLYVTVCGGFPYSDVAEAGMSFVVATDNDAAAAQAYGERLCRAAVNERHLFQVEQFPPQEAVRLAVVEPEGPIVLIEASDNVGGGAPGDATHVLAELLGVERKSLILMCDRTAVNLAIQAGVGNNLQCPVGGKTFDLNGPPVIIEGTIRALTDGKYVNVGPFMTGQLATMGKTAVVEAGNVTLVLTEERVAPFDIAHLWSVGLRAEMFHIIVVKSAVHWRTAFGDVYLKALHVKSPGCCTSNLRYLTYHNLNRPVFPFDEM